MRVVEGVAAQVMPLCLDASKSGTARWSTSIAEVVAIHIESGLDTGCLEGIKHLVCVATCIWSVIKCESYCLHNTAQLASAKASLHQAEAANIGVKHNISHDDEELRSSLTNKCLQTSCRYVLMNASAHCKDTVDVHANHSTFQGLCRVHADHTETCLVQQSGASK